MGIPSQREATHDIDSNTGRLEQRREKRMQPATQAQSRHAIAVNARGSASICSSVIPYWQACRLRFEDSSLALAADTAVSTAQRPRHFPRNEQPNSGE